MSAKANPPAPLACRAAVRRRRISWTQYGLGYYGVNATVPHATAKSKDGLRCAGSGKFCSHALECGIGCGTNGFNTGSRCTGDLVQDVLAAHLCFPALAGAKPS